MLAPQGRLFGTNGVRFIPGVTGDMGFALKLAESIGTYFSDGEILVGRDGRLTGQMMLSSVTAGLMSSGRNIAETGVVPTPALQFATKALGYRGSVMITASHNPSQYNGVKVMGSDGVEISRLDEQRIEKVFHDGSANKANWRDVGTARPEQSVIRTYLNGIMSRVNVKLIAERRLRVVVDSGNGAQSIAAPYLLEALGCKVITINSIIDGNFPGRGPEPTPENLRDLVVAVRASNADLGVAYDGDGDRSIFCDEGGNLYWGDQSGTLIADYLLERNPPASTIVTPVSSSQVIETVAKRRGAKVIRTRVGSVDVSRTIMERKALMGFEENGGGFFPAHIPTRDGGMTTAMLLEVVAARGAPLSRLIAAAFPKFFLTKTKVPVDPSKVREIIRAIERQGDGKVEKVDGVKVWVDEKTWALIRPSDTEPIVRVFVESETKEKADSTAKKFVKAVKSA